MPIHPTAEVHPSAIVHETAEIGARVIIGENTVIGEGCEILAGAVVCSNVKMGKHNRLHYYAIVGNDPQHVTFDRSLKTGVTIGNNNVFREHSTVHRSIDVNVDTIIGNNNYLMASGHIAHDCVIGDHVIVANIAGIAGHVSIGDRAFISGPVGVHQWVRVGRLAMVGGMSGVGRDVPPFMMVKGNGELTGLNVVGLRRAGVSAATRVQLKFVYRELFRSGRLLKSALEGVRADLANTTIAPEVQEFLDFCSVKSKRGLCRGPRGSRSDADDSGDDGA